MNPAPKQRSPENTFMPTETWYVYILRCCDNSLYTGVTTDCERRLLEHNHSARGAKYTRARRPVTLVYREEAADRSSAQRREVEIKRLSASQKAALLTRQDSGNARTA